MFSTLFDCLGGWMIFYSALLRLSGGVTIFRNNILLIWFLIFAVFVSALARFAGTQRYAAVLVIGLALITFHIAVPRLIAPKHYGPADQTGTRASHSATTWLIWLPKTRTLWMRQPLNDSRGSHRLSPGRVSNFLAGAQEVRRPNA
jgi:hypothetical protein